MIRLPGNGLPSELDRNFAINANAGSGKTTAIAERLAGLTLVEGAGEILSKTVVVTFTRKAALEIRQKARLSLMEKLTKEGGHHEGALEDLGRAFFGTIHSFCLLLARRYGQPLGVDLDPEVVEDATDATLWEGFLESDPMHFQSVGEEALRTFLRFRPLNTIFDLAQILSVRSSRRLMQCGMVPERPEPDWTELASLLERKPSRKGVSARNLEASQRALGQWAKAFREEREFLPLIKPFGTANGVVESYDGFFKPIKDWCARVAGLLAAELADRYRLHRVERRVQSYDDQIELALRLIEHPEMLDRIRRDGYRILLDEAQDTDPAQFSVLVEITRAPGALPGSWPGEGAPPEAGRFCMVGDAQQSIYGGRADIRNYRRHLEAMRTGQGNEVLDFGVTFRLPERLIDFMNGVVAPGFAPTIPHNQSLDGDCLQVAYLGLSPRPAVAPGAVSRFSYPVISDGRVGDRLKKEVDALADLLIRLGPEGVGVDDWSQVCLLAPRRQWLETARESLTRAGLPVSLQTRASRNGDRPAYAWVAGLLAIVVDPENGFEWAGVLREIFGIGDGEIAGVMSGAAVDFSPPEEYPEGIRDAIGRIRPFILKCDEPGIEPVRFLDGLIEACRLKERLAVIGESVGGMEDLEAIRLIAGGISEDGGGVRDLQTRLVSEVKNETPSGQSGRGMLNLVTCHSGKGLEWPVVIPIGLWRELRRPVESGFALIEDAGGSRVYFDPAGVPGETTDSRTRELTREYMRLLYVTLTRASRHLLLPLPEDMAGEEGSFLSIWAGGEPDRLVSDLKRLPEVEDVTWEDRRDRKPSDLVEVGIPFEPIAVEAVVRAREVAGAAPRRLLPHELAVAHDEVRRLLHESGPTETMEPGEGGDPVDYGLWWHETMEFLPWGGDCATIDHYLEERLQAVSGESFGVRARREVDLLLASELWTILQRPGVTIHTEVAVFVPGEDRGWIDGILDFLALQDGAEADLVIDWKTNRRRRGEDDQALLDRLGATYAPQLAAYSRAIGRGLRRGSPRALVYSTVLGRAVETTPD
ncbi:MAG: UvrD-helicase domain-containing protein [Opitutaceae bacterium]